MADEKEKTDALSDQQNQNAEIEKLSDDEMRQSRIVRKTPAQRRLVIGIIAVGIIVLAVVVMNVAP